MEPPQPPSSRPEERRPFVPQPSPLLTKNYDAEDRHTLRPGSGVAERSAPAAFSRASGRPEPSRRGAASAEFNRRYGSAKSGSGHPRASQPPASTNHRSSIGHVMPVDLETLIETPDLDSTLNAGSFPLNETMEASKNTRKTPDNIMDRPLTPLKPVSTNQTGGTGRSSRKIRSQHGDTSRTRGQSRTSEAVDIQVDPNRPIAKTFVRPEPPRELLDYPVIFNPRTVGLISTYAGHGWMILDWAALALTL
ncbi:hypothetical protein RUND412_009564 [Rhizina undulata]